jgi:glutathione S-transferase
MTDTLTVYTMPGSPYARRVELVLSEKGLAYDVVPLSRSDGDLRTEEHLRRSPRGRVPVLVDGDVTLTESQAVVEYQEERFPTPALLPSDPAARAALRIEEFECLLYFLPALGPIAKLKFMTPPEEQDQTAIDAAVAALAEEQDRVERRAAERNADYILGGDFCRADLTWLTAVEIGERGGLALTASRYPWLTAWRRDRLSARPSYAASYPAHWR